MEEDVESNVPKTDMDNGEGKETKKAEASQDNDIRTGVAQTLKELVDDLPTFVPEPALPDVSLPYIFICLLHLANEKTLSISSVDGNLNDLIITRDPDA